LKKYPGRVSKEEGEEWQQTRVPAGQIAEDNGPIGRGGGVRTPRKISTPGRDKGKAWRKASRKSLKKGTEFCSLPSETLFGVRPGSSFCVGSEKRWACGEWVKRAIPKKGLGGKRGFCRPSIGAERRRVSRGVSRPDRDLLTGDVR